MSNLTPDFEKEADDLMDLVESYAFYPVENTIYIKDAAKAYMKIAYNQGAIDRIKNAKKSLEEIQGDNHE